jgi:hypothetical protein
MRAGMQLLPAAFGWRAILNNYSIFHARNQRGVGYKYQKRREKCSADLALALRQINKGSQ